MGEPTVLSTKNGMVWMGVGVTMTVVVLVVMGTPLNWAGMAMPLAIVLAAVATLAGKVMAKRRRDRLGPQLREAQQRWKAEHGAQH